MSAPPDFKESMTELQDRIEAERQTNNPMNTPRTITDHIVPGAAGDTLTITVMDPPKTGGANHRYLIEGFNNTTNPSGNLWDVHPTKMTLIFQNGPIAEAGVNGITQEVLLAIVIDRLNSFQEGPYACIENQNALMYAELSLNFLKQRTQKRMERGVEGTHAK